ncbi:MAG: hypothetical protein PHE53_10745 [Thermoguttaceae bacterium]|nr:hypothetical protein [Thermoguttaceae bacterium]
MLFLSEFGGTACLNSSVASNVFKIRVHTIQDTSIEGDEYLQFTITRLFYWDSNQNQISVPCDISTTITVRDDDVPGEPNSPKPCPDDTCTCEDTCETISFGITPLVSNATAKANSVLGTNFVQTDLLSYSSTYNPHPIAAKDTTLQVTNGGSALTGVEVSGSIGGISTGTVYYDGTSAVAGESYRFALQVDGSNLTTGQKSWTMNLVQRYANGTSVTRTYTGVVDMFNTTGSSTGYGWNIREGKRLIADGSDIVLSDKGLHRFVSDGAGGYTFKQNYNTSGYELSGNWTTGFTLKANTGEVRSFNTLGLLTLIANADGQTVYTYTDADNDGLATDLATITSPGGLVTTFGYTNGLLSSSTTPSGDTTTYTHDANRRLTQVTFPDPDGAGSQTSPTNLFTYDSTTGLMTSMTNASGEATSFTYDAARRLSGITYPDGTTEDLTSAQASALVDLSEEGTPTTPASLRCTDETVTYKTDSLGNITRTQVNRYGQPVQVTERWNTTNAVTTVYGYNLSGQVVTQTTLDPDGSGPLQSTTTSYTYDSDGYLLKIIHPDNTKQIWTYTQIHPLTNPHWKCAATYTDETGLVTQYTWDTSGQLLSESVVVSSTDTRTTSYTWTSSPVNASDPPAGLISTITDPEGNVTKYQYNSRGFVTQRIRTADSDEEVFETYAYNSKGCLTSQTNAAGETTSYSYDNLGRVISMTLPDPDGAAGTQTSPVWSYTYNAAGQKLTEMDPSGNVTTYTYDDVGRVLTVTQPDPDGVGSQASPVKTYTYNTDGLLTGITNPLGNTTTYSYDVYGRQTGSTQPDPDGNGSQTSSVTSQAYNAYDWVTSTTDAMGNVTTYAYDAYGRIISITQPDPDGSGALTAPVTSRTYDKRGQISTETDALGHVTSYVYDAIGQLASVTRPDPDGSGSLNALVTLYTYDTLGQVTQVTRRTTVGQTVTDISTTYEYDALGRVVKTTAPDPDASGTRVPVETSYTYDDAGRTLTTTTTSGTTSYTVTYTYDHLGRQTSVTYPDPDGDGTQLANQVISSYNALGLVTQTEDSLGNTTSYIYDPLGRLLSETDANGNVTSYTYNADGAMASLTDAEGNTTSWTYDNSGRMTQETNELNASRAYTYNANGQLVSKTDRLGRTTTYTYDNLGRQTGETWLDANSQAVHTFTYTYDSVGNLLSVTDDDTSYTYSYNNVGQTTSVATTLDGLTPTVTQTLGYNALGQRVSDAMTIGTTADYQTSYVYDNAGNLLQQIQRSQTGGNAVQTKRAEWTYTGLNQVASLSRYESASGTGNLIAAGTYTYDAASRLTSLQYTVGQTTLAGYTYTYDRTGRMTSMDSVSDGMASYTYDDVGQLTGADYDYQTDETYTYDDTGNRTNAGYTTGSNNRTTSDGVYNYTYDAEGNMTSRTSISGGAVTEYTWDYRNRLTSVTQKASAGGAAQWIVEYTYDYQNRLVKRSDDSDAAGSAVAEVTTWIYDGIQMVLQFDGTGDLTSTDLSHRYMYGPAVDQILADEAVGGDTYWTLTDHQNTVRDLANAVGVVTHRSYNTFGVLTDETASAVDCLFGYTGKMFDDVTELQNNVNRWYNPTLGKWLSEDPIGFNRMDVNLYRYVRNGVSNYIDTTGLAFDIIPQVKWFIVDQSGNQFVGYDHASLLKQLQNMVNSGIRIESLVVKGHGHELGLYDGMAALFFVPDDNENMILMGDENVLGILKKVTDDHTSISLRGCFTSEAADNTAHRLPGVTVSGSPIPVWGIPWTTWTIGPWINYRYPQSISHSHAK